MNRPRILCLIDTIGKGGGAEHLVAVLAPRLREHGLDVTVAPIADWPVDYQQDLTDAGVPVVPFHAGYSRVSARSIAALARLVRREPFDICWGHMLTGNAHARIGAKLGGGRSVVTIHSEGHLENPPSRIRDRLAVTYEKRVLTGANAAVAVSSAVAHDFGQFFGLGDIAVAHNGVDVDQLRRVADARSKNSAREDFGIASGDFLIVCAARYVAKKGQTYLVEALARLKAQGMTRIKLVLAGVGAARSPLNQDVARLGLGDVVQIHDVIDQTRLIPLIAAADACVMPSLREPFGIAAAEAMALGVPTVLTAVDGFVELAGVDHAALLVPPADPPALAEAIRQLSEDCSMAQTLGKRGARRIAGHFSLDACAERWAEIFDAVHTGQPIPGLAA